MQIKETEFYKICDKVDATIEPINEKLEKDGGIPYFPTVSELKEHHVEENVKKYLSFLIFLNNNPYNLDTDEARETIAYSRHLLKKYLKIV